MWPTMWPNIRGDVMACSFIALGAFVAAVFYPIFAYLSVQARDEDGGIVIWGVIGLIIASVAIAAGFISAFWVGALIYAFLWVAAIGAAALAVRHG